MYTQLSNQILRAYLYLDSIPSRTEVRLVSGELCLTEEPSPLFLVNSSLLVEYVCVCKVEKILISSSALDLHIYKTGSGYSAICVNGVVGNLSAE